MKTILIVDDEPAARYGLRRALEARYRIAEADSAEAAREALPREQPDLVLLDVVLPGQDGMSFLKWLREQGSEVPVLMVSALDTAKTVVWNGPMGIFEMSAFANGSRQIAMKLSQLSGAVTVIGGGDTAACVTGFGLSGKGLRIGRASATRCKPPEAGDARKRK